MRMSDRLSSRGDAAFVVRRERALDGDGSPASRGGRVLDAARRAPKGHDGIADELVDGAALLFDAGGDEREVLIDEVGDLGGGHFFAGRCEADDVGEHDGEHAFFGAGADPALLDKPHDQSAGHVASEGAQAVEHRVERSRQAVDLAKMAAGQRHHLVEIKIADRSRALGGAADRAVQWRRP